MNEWYEKHVSSIIIYCWSNGSLFFQHSKIGVKVNWIKQTFFFWSFFKRILSFSKRISFFNKTKAVRTNYQEMAETLALIGIIFGGLSGNYCVCIHKPWNWYSIDIQVAHVQIHMFKLFTISNRNVCVFFFLWKSSFRRLKYFCVWYIFFFNWLSDGFL